TAAECSPMLWPVLPCATDYTYPVEIRDAHPPPARGFTPAARFDHAAIPALASPIWLLGQLHELCTAPGEDPFRRPAQLSDSAGRSAVHPIYWQHIVDDHCRRAGRACRRAGDCLRAAPPISWPWAAPRGADAALAD